MKRWDVINKLIQAYNYERYLEIGTRTGSCYDRVECKHKVGVDPDPKAKADIQMNSDEFFQSHQDKFDIIFIDGLHHADQAWRDLLNAVIHLRPLGSVVVHDCNPLSYQAQKVPREVKNWNGDVWKAWTLFRIKWKRELESLNTWEALPPDGYTVDTDSGIGILHLSESEARHLPSLPFHSLDMVSWEEFTEKREELLDLISVDEFIKSLPECVH